MEGLAWEAIFAAGTFFFLGAISPGPSVMVVIRNTIVGGRSQGVACAVGHGIGFGIYAISAVFGLIVLLENAPEVFLILQLIGVGLLIWYGYLMWFDDVNLDEKSTKNDNQIKRQGFLAGILRQEGNTHLCCRQFLIRTKLARKVSPPNSLDLDHFGAHMGELVATEGTGKNIGQVEDTSARKHR